MSRGGARPNSGRKFIAPADRMTKVLPMRLTPRMYDDIMYSGGVSWLRQTLADAIAKKQSERAAR